MVDDENDRGLWWRSVCDGKLLEGLDEVSVGGEVNM